MPALNLLELDITKLLEEHTIKEAEQMRKKVQNESERKKVDLRTLVGERYRDLIQAADTIAGMMQTSELVITRIGKMKDTCHQLQQKYLIGFKMDSSDKMKESTKSYQVNDSVVMQIKILMDLPEQIWSATDNGDYLFATQLFMFAQHINYSLKLEKGSEELISKFPIISKQWDTISQFRSVILNGCYKRLQSSDLSTEMAANSLASLKFLDGTSSVDLLKKLISSRSKAVEVVTTDSGHDSVRNRIKYCVQMLIHTVGLLYSCFIEAGNKNEGLVAQNVAVAAGSEATKILSLLGSDEDLMRKLLSSVAGIHKSYVKNPIEDITQTDLSECITSWLSWVQSFVRTRVSKLLDLVITIKGINSIREEVLALEMPQNWETMCLKLSSQKTINFWGDFFQPLLTERVKEILNTQWDGALSNLKNSIRELLNKVSHDKYDFPEHDLRWFVWKDSPNDIPQKLSKTAREMNKPLIMKTRGYSPNLAKLCEILDGGLLSMLQDLQLYLFENENPKKAKNSLAINISSMLNKFFDREIIQDELRLISAKKVNGLRNFIKQECLSENPKFGKREVNAIVSARFLQALTVLCPNLNKCFTMSNVFGSSMKNTKWQSITDTMKDDSNLAWSVWSNLYKTKIHNHRKRYLQESSNILQMHTLISEWEKVSIEEEGEEGKRMVSEIYVPFQPSVPLLKFLAAVNKDLNLIIPHTVPKKVLHDIIDTILISLLEYYSEVSKNNNLKQKEALQALLDVKYISLLMVSRENKIRIDKSTAISEDIRSKIDPFDLDVFYPFVHRNVKKSAQRTQLIFGNIVPHSEQLHSLLGARVENSSGDGSNFPGDPPGVLAVCTVAPWFLPLALTAQTRGLSIDVAVAQEKTQRKKLPTKAYSGNDSTETTVKSGAAAFFGAMGSDWFGTA